MSDAEQRSDALVELHLWDYLKVLLNRLHLALAVFAVVLVLGGLFTLTRTPLFRASSRILVERGSIDLTSIKGAYEESASGGLASYEFMPTQLKLISSRPVLEQALQTSGALSQPQFKNSRDPVRSLAELLQVQQIRDSRLVDVSIVHAEPELTAHLVNSIVDAYRENSRQRRLGVSEEGVQELRKMVGELRGKLDASTREIESFLQRHEMISFGQAKEIAQGRLKSLNESYWKSEPLRLSLKARVAAAQSAIAEGRPVDTLPDVIESEVISGLSLEVARLGVEYAELKSRFGENHPKLQSLDIQMEATRTQMGIFATSALNSLFTTYDQAQQEVELIQQAIREQEQEIARINDISVEYNFLSQNKQSLQRNYDKLVFRIEEIDLNRLGGQGDNVFIISRAEVPQTKFYPNNTKNVMMAMFFGFVLAIFACFFAEYMDTSVKGAEDVQPHFDAPVLSVIPSSSHELEQGQSLDFLVHAKPRSHFAESFRVARTALAFGQSGETIKHMVVTSTTPEEGKTTISINLATVHAQSGKKTLLIDADLRKPRVHRTFGIENTTGLATALSEDVDPAELTHPTEVENLFVMPSGPSPENPVELLDSTRLEELVRRMEKEFDLIIFDSPPSLTFVDALVVARAVDGMVVVIRTYSTQKGAVRQFSKALLNSGERLLGIVMNDADAPKASMMGYKYGYYQYGHRHYGHGSNDSDAEQDSENASNTAGAKSSLDTVKDKVSSLVRRS